MQSYVMSFFPDIAEAKQDTHSMSNMLDMSCNNASVGSHITRKTVRLPVLLMDRSVFLPGSAIWTIAIHYRAQIYKWLLQNIAAIKDAPIYCAMVLRSCFRRNSLPYFVGIGVLTARLYNYITIRNHIYGPQLFLGLDSNIQNDLVIENTELCNKQSFYPSLLGSKHNYARVALQCIFSIASLKVHTTPKQIDFNGRCLGKNNEISAFWRILSRNGQYLTYIGAFVTLQLFLQLNRVNITTLLLPMLFQTRTSRSNALVVSNIVIVLVNTCGILGSSYTNKQHGRLVTFTVNAVLMVICQITIPFMVEVQIGLGGGTRILKGYMTAMFVLTCVVSCGLSWSWGSLFYAVPGEKIQSARQVTGMALNFGICFVQMQYFLLMLCRLKNAVLAYYAMWIWSY